MQWLTGKNINSDTEAYEACCSFFEKYGENGPKLVILSSVDY
jgi:pyridoxal/pyridoxine/pyridoxamine kinase